MLLFSFSEISFADVPIDEAHFPDPVLREWIQELPYFDGWRQVPVINDEGKVTGYKWEWSEAYKDGILSNYELNQKDYLGPGNSDVADLSGIEYLPNLRRVYLPNVKVKVANISGFSKLTEFYLSGPNLESINASGCSSLTVLGCGDSPNMKNLNLSGCSALETLYCTNTPINIEGLTSCTSLKYFYGGQNQFTYINFSGLSHLEYICCDSPALTEVIVNGCTSLKELWMLTEDGSVEKLDLSSCIELLKLGCINAGLETLDLSYNTKLVDIHCENNSLTELDLSNNIKLTSVNCSPQTREGMKAKLTDEGYEVDLSEYVSKLENIVSDSIKAKVGKNSEEIEPLSFDVSTGIVLFAEYPSELFYQYNTHSPNETYMNCSLKGEGGTLKFEALERGGFDSDNIICDMKPSYYIDNQGQKLTEATISGYDYGTYGKLGFTADGNSRLILRVQTDKPGYATFRLNDDIGATLENLDRQKLTETSQVRTSLIAFDIDNNEDHQVSVVLIAPEMFPEYKNFPSDTFKVHVNFYADDGTTAEKDLELKIETAPVLLIHGFMGKSESTFGKSKGIWNQLERNGFDVYQWNYDGSRAPSDILKKDFNGLFRTLADVFNKYAEKGIACTRADIVAYSMGGLIARKFLHKPDGELLDDGNNWSVRSYKQGMVRRVVTVATPHEGSPLADIVLGIRPFVAPLAKALDFVLLKAFGGTYFKDLGNAFREMTTTASREYGYPSDVPMYSIYGDVKYYVDVIANSIQEVGMTAAQSYEVLLFTAHPELAIIMCAVGLGTYAVVGGLNTLYNEVIFNGDGHDLVVPVMSARGNPYDEAGHDGLEYRHTMICKQDDVGSDVVSFLKNSKYGVTYMKSTIAAESVYNASQNMQTVIAETKKLNFIEALNLTIEPTNFTVSQNASQVVTFTATAKDTVPYDVYCAVGIEEGYRLFKIARADSDGDKFEAKISFGIQDAGIMNVFCFSRNPDDTDGTSIYVSNTVQIEALIDTDSLNINNLDFVGSSGTIYTNVNSEIAVGLYALTEDGNMFDVSSPLMGTEWTADDSEIASVSEAGMVQGLKKGTTTLRAEFNGLTAAISVDVGPAYEDPNDDPEPDPDPNPEPEPEPEPSPTPQSAKHSSGGCNASALGICALLMLLKKKR